MKNKIVGIFVCTLLISTVMPISADTSVTNVVRKGDIENSLNGGWIKHFEGTSWAHVVRQTDDGYILVGATDVADTGDGLVMKVDTLGNENWTKTFPNAAFEGLWITNDEGYIVSGWRKEPSKYKGMMVKLTKNGTVEWEKTYGGPYSLLIQCQQTTDGGYVASGFCEVSEGNNDAWLIKTDSNGNLSWDKTYGTETTKDTFHSIHQTSDDGYILPGWNTNRTDYFSDSYVVKTDVDGNISWEKTLGTGKDIFGINRFDQINMGRQAPDGGYIFTGYKASTFFHYLFSIGSRIRLVKTDTDGNVDWDISYGNPLYFDWGLWVEPTIDGGYITSGSRNGFGRLINLISTGSGKHLSCQLWVIKVDADGNKTWDFTYRGATARCVQEIDDGYIIAGHKGIYYGTKGILLIKIDKNGNIN